MTTTLSDFNGFYQKTRFERREAVEKIQIFFRNQFEIRSKTVSLISSLLNVNNFTGLRSVQIYRQNIYVKMAATIQKTKSNAITLKGSVQLITDYLHYGINNILFQRGIYPPESFKAEDHFGLSILISTDKKIHEFLDTIFQQMKEWLVKQQIQQLSLVISNISTQEALERWDFKIEYEAKSENGEEITGTKDIKIIQKEIKDVLRQICSTVSFLPLLDCPCSFDLHIYATPEADIPEQWGERGPSFIANSEELQLKSFSTSIHRMNTIVSYKAD